MKDRLKLLRTKLNYTQDQFANELHVSKSIITSYEMGRRLPSTRTISLICNRFNVNEEWLRDGTGDMFGLSSKKTEINKVTTQMLNDTESAFRYQLYKSISDMSDEDLKVFEKFFKHLA